MISLDVINEEILSLEDKPPTYATIERLAWLYVVRDHNRLNGQDTTVRSGCIAYQSNTEFGKAVHGKDEQEVFTLLDELMTVLQQMHPRCYSAVIGRLS